jgi:hypothetical protein
MAVIGAVLLEMALLKASTAGSSLDLFVEIYADIREICLEMS